MGLLDAIRHTPPSSNASKERSTSASRGADERGRDHTPLTHSHLNPNHEDERGESRGRGFNASGRGGAGNMSRSRVRSGDNPSETAEEIALARSRSRSRSRARHHGHELPIPSGRGGMGNVRSPSRDPSKMREVQELDNEDAQVKERYEAAHVGDKAVHGRGGVGNIE